MQSFLHEIRMYKTVKVDNKQNNSNCTLVTVILVATIFILIIIIWLVIRKNNCLLMQIVSKRLTNVRVNVEQTPTNGDDVMKSVVLEEKHVSYVNEGQQNAFRRTDATMAWAQR